MSSRTFDFKDSEHVLVQSAPLNLKSPSDAEIEKMLTIHQIKAFVDEQKKQEANTHLLWHDSPIAFAKW